jgi:hypothetical protein
MCSGQRSLGEGGVAWAWPVEETPAKQAVSKPQRDSGVNTFTGEFKSSCDPAGTLDTLPRWKAKGKRQKGKGKRKKAKDSQPCRYGPSSGMCLSR